MVGVFVFTVTANKSQFHLFHFRGLEDLAIHEGVVSFLYSCCHILGATRTLSSKTDSCS